MGPAPRANPRCRRRRSWCGRHVARGGGGRPGTRVCGIRILDFELETAGAVRRAIAALDGVSGTAATPRVGGRFGRGPLRAARGAGGVSGPREQPRHIPGRRGVRRGSVGVGRRERCCVSLVAVAVRRRPASADSSAGDGRSVYFVQVTLSPTVMHQSWRLDAWDAALS